ncbi:MAG: hypothetical protein IJZ33_08055 [Clostridia bacterium]|nr:hypothetical protein [Clostridia bacterium]
MKRIVIALLALVMVFSCVACTNNQTTDEAEKPSASVEGSTEESTAPSTSGTEEVTVMTYEQFVAAAIDTKVCVETYVQAKQGWWEKEGQGVGTFYTQNEEGAYFLYEMPCTKAEYDQLTAGTKIRVNGYKAEWSGEVEIVDATFEILEGNFVATAKDVTALLGTDELIKSQNQFVAFKGLTVAASKNADGEDVAFLYKWDGSGQEGDDLYFKVTVGENTYSFTVESYLCGADTDVYKAVKELKVGDKIDAEGFLYWYEGVNPHITAVTPVVEG